MDSIIETFHIDWKLMIAQIVNFIIVAAVLWYFAVKPIMKIMRERTEKIEKGLQDAAKIEENLKNTEETKKAEIVKAKQEAQAILEEANKTATKNKDELLDIAKKEVEKVKIRAKEEIQDAKKQMLKEIKAETAGLIVTAVEKIISQDLPESERKKMLDKTINELK
jgi:F-type H+-transporting ATPase subunit b